MDLTQPLINLVHKVNGAVGALIIDNEGEAVTYYSSEGESQIERIRLIGAYQRIWLRDCLEIVKQNKLSRLDKLVHKYEFGTVIIKTLNSDHALVLIGSDQLYQGEAILQMDKIANLINADL